MSHRIQRVNTLIRREISELIQNQLRDPRLGEFLTVTEVETTPDLKHAKVFVSSIGGAQEEAGTIGVLNAAAGFMRTELARKVTLRRVPELSFHWDNSIEHGDHILRLIDELTGEEKP